MPEIDRFIVISPVLELDMRFSDHPVSSTLRPPAPGGCAFAHGGYRSVGQRLTAASIAWRSSL
jgi:hypothetical protein